MASDDTLLLHLQPGKLLHYDFRSDVDQKQKLSNTFRIVQWNIERGVQLEGIIDTLRACEADILILQELDIDCSRSGYVNTPRAIAEALGMQVYFVCEFEELDSEVRTPYHRVGPLSPVVPVGGASAGQHGQKDYTLPPHVAQRYSKSTLRHFHGNAIFSRRATLHDPVVIAHSWGLDWELYGKRVGEPRRGYRSALRVMISPSERTSSRLPPVYIYCCHLEIFCGILNRVRALSDCLHDATQLTRRAAELPPTSLRPSLPAFIIGGDLNTIAHSVVRLSSRFANDRMRWLSLGETEACWLQRCVLSRNMNGVSKACCPFSLRFPRYVYRWFVDRVLNSDLTWRFVYGFSANELRKLDNREVCFFDPSDKYNSVTLNHPAYHGLVQGKLDWLLLSNFQPKPFRNCTGGARPVDVDRLVALQSVTDPSTIRYLRHINGSDDERRQVDVAEEKRCTPSDGYVLFNDKYKESDHRGLLMTVTQHAGRPDEVYPPDGAPYTASVYAATVAAVARLLPVVLLTVALSSRWYVAAEGSSE